LFIPLKEYSNNKLNAVATRMVPHRLPITVSFCKLQVNINHYAIDI
jgi:hypothetical protein